MTATGTAGVRTPAAGPPLKTRGERARELARSMAGGALPGALSGLLASGVLGRPAMRLLAVPRRSPRGAA